MNTEKLIWVLEDDSGVQFVYEEILGLRYQLKLFSTLGDLKEEYAKGGNRPDLLIADLRLPDGYFLTFLSEQQKSGNPFAIPFIVVSLVDDLDVLRTCFQDGAVDYLTKPFTKNELIVKVERILTRAAPAMQVENSGVILEPGSLRVRNERNETAQLTAKELQIFSVLHRSMGKVITRSELEAAVWGDSQVGTKTLDVHLFNLRKKLAKLGIQIEHVPPQGYSLHKAPDTQGSG